MHISVYRMLRILLDGTDEVLGDSIKMCFENR
jgi:hypothetical protein